MRPSGRRMRAVGGVQDPDEAGGGGGRGARGFSFARFRVGNAR
jgi:hypothetical protein